MIERSTLSEWQDRAYLLQSALEDADRDLLEDASLRSYTEVFQNLYATASDVARFRIEPKAIADKTSQ